MTHFKIASQQLLTFPDIELKNSLGNMLLFSTNPPSLTTFSNDKIEKWWIILRIEFKKKKNPKILITIYIYI